MRQLLRLKVITNSFVRRLSNTTKTNVQSWSKLKENNMNLLIMGTSITLVVAYKTYEYHKNIVLAKEQGNEDVIPGELRKDLPYFTLDEISKHANRENGIWVTYKQGVYDVTTFVNGHPGGDQILMAAGSSVEPFWMLYAVHNNQHVYNILETLRIGNLREEDTQDLIANMSDPYQNDPKRHKILKPASVKPFNAESPMVLLVENFITPNDLFYVRNHLPVPEIDAETYRLEVQVEGSEKIFSFSLEDLKKLPKHTITATIMCAGNRRSEMIQVRPVKGLSWGAAAVGNAKWTGVKLSELLRLCGVTDADEQEYKHVQFEGIDSDATGKSYGASIPFWKAMNSRQDVLLAYEMNDCPLPRDHGFPLRIVVPGVVGARNVKWLGRIVIACDESDSHWQRNDYKGFGPSETMESADFTKARAIQELPVMSAICKPEAEQSVQLEDGMLTVKGYAWSGGGQKIVRVDVTVDEGNTWHVAKIDQQDQAEPPQHWSWTFWSARIPVDSSVKKLEIWSKAVDSCYNTQPESFRNIWNFRGVLSNAYHRVPITIK